MNSVWKRSERGATIEEVVLANTGCSSLEELNCVDKVYTINGLKDAAALIISAVKSGQPVYIRGDYDTDGICASSILYILLRALGVIADTHLPHRFTEGFGLSVKMVEDIPAGSGLLVTVDNGIVANEAIQMAKDKGLTVLLTDHHLPRTDGLLPPADIIIDPNAIENSATFNGYCGAALAYKIACEVIDELGDETLMPLKQKLLSLAAIATVADVMELKEDNRRIVKQGLVNMLTKDGATSGLRALLRAFGLSEHVTAKDIGFRVAPSLNAPGRLLDNGAIVSMGLLTFDGDEKDADILAGGVVGWNEKRKYLKEMGLFELRKHIAENGLENDAPLCVYMPGLHEGIVGIYAGELAEEFGVPCLVFTDAAEDGVIKGSARTAGGIHLKQLLDTCADDFIKYGGHAGAAGMSLKKDMFRKLCCDLQHNCPPVERISGGTVYDLELEKSDLPGAIEELERFAPFGEGNPEIVFRVNDIDIVSGDKAPIRIMGSIKQHAKLASEKFDVLAFDLATKYLRLCFDGASDDAGKEIIRMLDAMESPEAIAAAAESYFSEHPDFVLFTPIDVIGTLSQNFFKGAVSDQIEALDLEAT